jgi:hypothetical protein
MLLKTVELPLNLIKPHFPTQKFCGRLEESFKTLTALISGPYCVNATNETC